MELISEEASQTLTTGFDLFYPSHVSQRSLLSSLLMREANIQSNGNANASLGKEDPFLHAVLVTLSSRRNVSVLFSPIPKQSIAQAFSKTPIRSLNFDIFDESPEKGKVKAIISHLLTVASGSIARFFQKEEAECDKGLSALVLPKDVCSALTKQSFPIILVMRLLRFESLSPPPSLHPLLPPLPPFLPPPFQILLSRPPNQLHPHLTRVAKRGRRRVWGCSETSRLPLAFALSFTKCPPSSPLWCARSLTHCSLW